LASLLLGPNKEDRSWTRCQELIGGGRIPTPSALLIFVTDELPESLPAPTLPILWPGILIAHLFKPPRHIISGTWCATEPVLSVQYGLKRQCNSQRQSYSLGSICSLSNQQLNIGSCQSICDWTTSDFFNAQVQGGSRTPLHPIHQVHDSF